MTNSDPTSLAQRISDIEEQIDELAAVVERCRKAMVLSKVSIACGCLILLASVFGVIGLGATGFVFGIAACIGGMVFFGATRSTLLETKARMQALDQGRSTLMDELPMRTIGERPDGAE